MHRQDPGPPYFIETDNKRNFSVRIESVAHSKLPSGRAASEVVVMTGLSAEDKAGLPPRPSKPVICLPTFPG